MQQGVFVLGSRRMNLNINRMLLLVLMLTTVAATAIPRVTRGVGTPSRVGTVSASTAPQESNEDGIEVDHDDDSYGADYDGDELDAEEDDVEEFKVGVAGRDRHQQQQQQQQHRRRGDQLQQVVTVRRHETYGAGPQGAGGSVRSQASSHIVTAESRIRTSGVDSVAHGTSATESGPSGEGAAGISREQWIERERKKNMRLFMIQRQIVEMLGLERRPNVTASSPQQQVIQQVYARRAGAQGSQYAASSDGQHQQQASRLQQQNNMARRYQALLPSCTEPLVSDHLDEQSSTSLRLQFNCDMFDSTRTRALRILSATLKLKKKPRQNGVAAVGVVSSNSGHVTRSHDNSEDPSTNLHDSDGSHVTDGQAGADILRVSLYSVSRPSPRRGGRRGSSLEVKRLIRSLVIPSDKSGWIRLNIRPTLEDWMRRGQTSGTVDVIVTDARRQQIIDAAQVFEPRNCSNTPSAELLMQLPVSIADTEGTTGGSRGGDILDDDTTSAETSGSDLVDAGTSLSSSEYVGVATSSGRYSSSGYHHNQHRVQMTPEDFVQPYVELVTAFEPLGQPASAPAGVSSASLGLRRSG